MSLLAAICALITLVYTASCTYSSADDVVIDLQYPSGWPQQYVLPENTLTPARIDLGKTLFYDKRLSRDSTLNCASCHRPSLAFADTLAISPGVEGRLGFRNTPSLANIVFVDVAHRDGGVQSIDLQAINPIEDHNEMGLPLPQLVRRLSQDENLQSKAFDAYGRAIDNLTIVFSLAAFVKSITSTESRYDQWVRGDYNLSSAEYQGLQLFEQHCESCHTPPCFGSTTFVNNGSHTDYSDDRGRARVTLRDEDEGRFRIASLRNVVLTAPYMHDGSYLTLRSVIEQYNAGGSDHPNQDERIQPLSLSGDDMADLESFLHTLTDSTLLFNPAYKEL